MMQGADHGRRVESTRREGQTVDVGSNVFVFFLQAKTLPGLFELGGGIIEQGDVVVTTVAVGVAAGAGA